MKQTAARVLLAGVAALLSLIVIVGGGELVLRGVLGVSTPYEEYEVVRFDERLGWRLVPGEYAFFHPSAFTVARISINESGLRNAPISMAVPTGRRRISVVGDSFVFAAALSEGETLTDRLRERVGPETEIVNVSAPGYGTGQQLLLLETLAENGYVVGETVVLIFFTNDILDNVGRTYGGGAEQNPTRPAFSAENGRLEQVHTPVDPYAGGGRASRDPTLLERSLFLSFIGKRAGVAAAQFPGIMGALASVGIRMPLPRTPGIITGWYGSDWRQMWEVTEALLARLQATVARMGAQRFIVAFMPSPFEIEPIFTEIVAGHKDEPAYAAFLADRERPQRTLLESCGANQIEFIDLSDALRENRGDEPAYFLREGHLNAHGSRIVAKALQGVLERPR